MPVSVVCCSHATRTNVPAYIINDNYTVPASMHLIFTGTFDVKLFYIANVFLFLVGLVLGTAQTMLAIYSMLSI